MTYEAFISRFPRTTPYARGVMVQCPAHEDRKASLAVSKGKDGGVVLKCFANCSTEAVVAALGLGMRDLFAAQKERSFKLNGNVKNKLFGTSIGPKEKEVKYEIETTYSYTDSLGRELYQAVRLKPKSFRQRHKVKDKWVWSMEGVERVLYRLPEVEKSEEVWIVEGEKDADNLVGLGFCATCNVGGAGKWLDGYTSSLVGKRIIICGDNDKPGQEHVELVFDSVAAKATSVKLIKLPHPHKDVSDFIKTFSQPTEATTALRHLAELATPHIGGVRMPIYSMADIEPHYQKLVNSYDQVAVDLSKWLPSLRRVRPLIPGNFVLFLGDTGVGKTNLLQNVFSVFSHLPSLFFELELTQEDMFERFFAQRAKLTCLEIEQEYKANGGFGREAITKQFPNLYICPEPNLTIDMFEELIVKSELKIGRKPVLVALDYFQLVKASQRYSSRYEKASDVAERVKLIAKATGTIIIGASQVDRASGKSGIGLHSGKDSGSLENSAGLVIGAAIDEEDSTLMHLKVFKATKGGAGTEVRCNFDGARCLITERANQEEPATETKTTELPPE